MQAGAGLDPEVMRKGSAPETRPSMRAVTSMPPRLTSTAVALTRNPPYSTASPAKVQSMPTPCIACSTTCSFHTWELPIKVTSCHVTRMEYNWTQVKPII